MKRIARQLHHHYRTLLTKENAWSFVTAVVLFAISMIAQNAAYNYILRVPGTTVDDLFLDHLPTLDLDVFIIQGALLLTVVASFLFLYKPQYINFGIKCLAVFVIVRSFMITLTHLGVSPEQLKFNQNSYGFWLYDFLYNSEKAFFFSGHTGMPFLLALIFWRETIWRYLFLITSFVFGMSVLFAHIHYSIDVFAAPFVTYSIYAIARYFFDFDYRLTMKNFLLREGDESGG